MNVFDFNINTYDTSHPLIVYGYGMGALNLLPLLIDKEINILAILDRDERYHHTFYPATQPIEVLPPEDIDTFDKSVPVLNTVTKVRNWSVSEFLETMGREDVYYIGGTSEWYVYKRRCDLIPQYKETAAVHIGGIDAARKLMADAASRGVYDASIEAYISGEWATLKRYAGYPRYFLKDIFTFTRKEVLADVGALDGGTAAQFADTCGREYEHIYAFEPSPTSYIITERRLTSEVPHSSAHRLAIMDHDGYVSFVQNNSHPGMSRVLNDDERLLSVEVPCTTLDAFFADKPHVPTFIKMDIEGAEISALNGARETILAHKPKLAICAYHKFEHLWEVPLLIHKLNPSYEIFMRTHLVFDDTVCYAR